QLTWFVAGLGGTGAVWYFLAQKRYRAAMMSAVATILLAASAVTFHRYNDQHRRPVQENLTSRRVPAPTQSTNTNNTAEPSSTPLVHAAASSEELALTSTAIN